MAIGGIKVTAVLPHQKGCRNRDRQGGQPAELEEAQEWDRHVERAVHAVGEIGAREEGLGREGGVPVLRRIEAGEKLAWGAILGVVFAQRQRQIPSIAAVIVLIFMFWLFVAHALFALFLGLQAAAQLGTSPMVLFQGNGPLMLLIGTAIGAGFAGVLFATTVTGLPLLLEYEVDFVTAMITSVQSVLANLVPMALWGITIAALVFVGMAPLFLGLFVVLPVLGHGTWHLYRRAVA